MKVSQIIEAKSVTNVFYGWSNELQLTVEGGQINLKLNEASLRDIAKVLNSKITEQDEEAREKLKEEQEVG
jgi:hypothetical protein